MTDIADRIAAARKEAETLKEKIKMRKDTLADTSRMYYSLLIDSTFNDS